MIISTFHISKNHLDLPAVNATEWGTAQSVADDVPFTGIQRIKETVVRIVPIVSIAGLDASAQDNALLVTRNDSNRK